MTLRKHEALHAIRYARILSLLAGLVLGANSLAAIDISGTISRTLTITEDSQLVGNVNCTVAEAPCILIGASDVRLKLNGFNLTGPATPPANCLTPANFLPADGISMAGRRNVSVLGPGIVERFRRHGVFVNTSTRVSVRQVTVSYNCFSGVFLGVTTESNVEDNVLVRNGTASAGNPCGGNCITNSHSNVISRNVIGGNGSAEPNNDFGIGLVGTSSFNEIEDNTVMGNTNGILIQAGARSNVLRRNIVVGNPPIQVNATFGAFRGMDIQNLAPTGANWMDGNVCLSYTGVEPSPCSYRWKIGGGAGVN